jgi:hypothetical protein
VQVAARLAEQLHALDIEALDTLEPRTRDVIRLYYGLAGTPRATLAETAGVPWVHYLAGAGSTGRGHRAAAWSKRGRHPATPVQRV